MLFRNQPKSLSRSYLYIGIFILFIFGCQNDSPQQEPDLKLVNLSHLNHLFEEIVIDGQEMGIIRIYSEYPDYGWVAAKDEGIACVDDAARAAVVYLRHFEITGDTTSLKRARKLLDFCRYMQAEDGQFYNFIYADYSINREGKTSYKSLGWWAARGLWALGEGYRIFHSRDPPYAELLKSHIQRTFVHIDTLLEHYSDIETINGFRVPRWLLYNSAADATSELMLGLAAYAEVSNDLKAKGYLETFAKGLLAMQIGDEISYPFGAFLSWKNVWHGWGNSQTQALARTAKLLNDQTIKNAAVKEASYFYPFWMKSGFPREMQFVKEDTFAIKNLTRFSQIAYAIRPAVVGSLRLYEVTGQARFAELAGELSTWFFGNNPASKVMYDPETGRGFDGILSETELNLNSGAESTIEALYSILEVEANPIARRKLEKFLNLQQITY
jgi:hypothetical protein